jgi:hypothetical protein
VRSLLLFVRVPFLICRRLHAQSPLYLLNNHEQKNKIILMKQKRRNQVPRAVEYTGGQRPLWRHHNPLGTRDDQLWALAASRIHHKRKRSRTRLADNSKNRGHMNLASTLFPSSSFPNSFSPLFVSIYAQYNPFVSFVL